MSDANTVRKIMACPEGTPISDQCAGVDIAELEQRHTESVVAKRLWTAALAIGRPALQGEVQV